MSSAILWRVVSFSPLISVPESDTLLGGIADEWWYILIALIFKLPSCFALIGIASPTHKQCLWQNLLAPLHSQLNGKLIYVISLRRLQSYFEIWFMATLWHKHFCFWWKLDDENHFTLCRGGYRDLRWCGVDLFFNLVLRWIKYQLAVLLLSQALRCAMFVFSRCGVSWNEIACGAGVYDLPLSNLNLA